MSNLTNYQLSDDDRHFELDSEEIARLIQDGFTEGRLDSEGHHVYWKIKIEAWED